LLDSLLQEVCIIEEEKVVEKFLIRILSSIDS